MYYDDFEVECLGDIEDYVYDIEVKDNHNFFANNILVHNSNYIDLTDVVFHPKLKWNLKPEQEIVDLLIDFCDTKLKPYIDKNFQKLADDLNAYANTIDMKREAVGKGIIQAKARYTLYVYDNENKRYETPELKIVGLEAIRSSVPKYFRDSMKTVYKMMYTHTEKQIHSKILELEKEYSELPIIQIGEPKGVSMAKYTNSNTKGVFGKGTPSHVKAAFTFNNTIKELKLTEKFQLINEGDKIKLYKLKMPNPFFNDTIAILDKVPPEFDLNKYVDRHLMFDKGFIKPIQRILSVRKWNAYETTNLEDLFGC